MLKTFKILTAASILLAQSAFAGVAFERVKEELWFKGEVAVLHKADYSETSQKGVDIDPQVAWDNWHGEVIMPEELETGLALWVAQK